MEIIQKIYLKSISQMRMQNYFAWFVLEGVRV
jgi:hypothetical protein